MENLFNLDFEVRFVVFQETKVEPFFMRSFSDLSLADDFEKSLKFLLPHLKGLFGCNFYYHRLNKLVCGTKKPDNHGD